MVPRAMRLESDCSICGPLMHIFSYSSVFSENVKDYIYVRQTSIYTRSNVQIVD